MIVRAIRQAFEERQGWLDAVADPIQDAIQAVLKRAPTLAKILHGEFLGHPLHPALITIPIGSWTSAVVLDLVDIAGVSHGFRRGADAACAIGLAGALASAVTGLADWSTTEGAAKRAGFVHGATNLAVAGLYSASLLFRAVHLRGVGIALSFVGYGLVGFSGWLGGELSFTYCVGVNTERCSPEGTGTPKADQAVAEGPDLDEPCDG